MLTQIISFPLTHPVIKAIEDLRMDITNSAIIAVNPIIPLVVETDTLNCAIDASLIQFDHSVAYFFVAGTTTFNQEKEPLWRT